MIKVTPTNSNNKITVKDLSGNINITTTGNLAEQHSRISQAWATSEEMVQGVDYSSKHYANTSKEYSEQTLSYRNETINAVSGFQNLVDSSKVSIKDVSQECLDNIETSSNGAVQVVQDICNSSVETINTTVNECFANIDNKVDESLTNINQTIEMEKQEIEELADLIKENAEEIANRTSFAMFDTILKDHVLTYEESKGLALQGTYVYKEAIAGSRYGYPDFYNKCLEEFENAQESEWIQPKINSDGIMGGNTFAVEASSFETNVGRQPYKSFDGNSSTKWGLNNTRSGWLTFYNPIPLKVSSIVYTPSTDFPAEDGGDLEILGSNDNSDWTSLWTGNYTGSSICTFNVNSQNYYKYYKISITNAIHNYSGLGDLTINAIEAIRKNPNGHIFYDISIKDQIDKIFNSTGMAWMYGIDQENERIFLPRNNFFEQATGDISEVGKSIEAGLPNIAGSVTTYNSLSMETTASGAFTSTQVTKSNVSTSSGNGREQTINIDASRSSSVYGNSDTVQPNAVKKLLYICVGNTTNYEGMTEVVNQGMEILEQVNQAVNNIIPNNTNVWDGQWIPVEPVTVFSSTAVGDYTVDLSDFGVPKDGSYYEVKLSGAGNTGNTSNTTLYVYSSIIGTVNRSGLYASAEGKVGCGETIMPVAPDLILNVKIDSRVFSWTSVVLQAYRRIGTNT